MTHHSTSPHLQYYVTLIHSTFANISQYSEHLQCSTERLSESQGTKNTTLSARSELLFLPFLSIQRLQELPWQDILSKLNAFGDKQHSCLTSLPVFTFLVLPCSSFSPTLRSIYNLLINLLSLQSMSVTFRNSSYHCLVPYASL